MLTNQDIEQMQKNRWSVLPLLLILLMPLGVLAESAIAPPETSEVTIGLSQVNDLPKELLIEVGKSMNFALPAAVSRLSVGDPRVADVMMLNGQELYVLGKKVGATNLIIWSKSRPAKSFIVRVGLDLSSLRQQFRAQFPQERDLQLSSLGRSVILHGHLANALQVSQVVSLAEAFVEAHSNDQISQSDDSKDNQSSVGAAALPRQQITRRVINLLKLRDPQQVMLEVKVAEVAKSVIDRMNFGLTSSTTTGGGTEIRTISGLFGASGLSVNRTVGSSASSFSFDAYQKDGLVKILAEPTLLSLSGQEASFLAGGKIFIPVARTNNSTGGTTLTLEEKEYGVGVKFTPVVLESGRIQLKVAPEVSELVTTGNPFVSSDGQVAVLPSLSTRKASTTVQLADGESFAIAGLVKNNVSGLISAFPGLGDLPIIGALFRSTDYRSDKTELLFVITPRLVQPVTERMPLPTDHFREPKRGEVFSSGKLESN